MNITTVILLILIGIGAGFVQRVSGFGIGIFSMLFLPHFLPTNTAAAAIACLFSCGTSSYNSVKYRRDISFKNVLPLLLAVLVAIPLAVYLSPRIPSRIFEIILGVFMVILSLYFVVFHNKVTIRATFPNGLLAGFLGGFLNGLFSTGGPPVVLYLTQASKSNMQYFATIQFYFAMTNIYATVNRAISGALSWELVGLAAVGFAGCMVGDFLGNRVFAKLDGNKLKRIIYIAMAISGVLMLVT